jgi:hypothetical protein
VTRKTKETTAWISIPDFREACKAADSRIRSEFAGAFAQEGVLEKAVDYIDALSDPDVRADSWSIIAEYCGYDSPSPVQSLVGENKWQPADAWDRIAAIASAIAERECAGDPLGPGVIVDETAQLKRGMATAGVAHQYAGCAGRVVNCTTWVIATLAGPFMRTWAGCGLYIPKKSWFTGRKETGTARRQAAGIPKGTRFATKPKIARSLFRHLRAKGVKFNYAAGDEVYGRDRRLRRDHERNGEAYAYFVPSDFQVKTLGNNSCKVDELRELAIARFEERSAGPGVNGPRYYEWAMIGVISRRHFLLVRRPAREQGESGTEGIKACSGQATGSRQEKDQADRVKDENLTFCLCYVPDGSPVRPTMRNLVLMAGRRWRAEEGNATAKGPVGWDQNQLRKWESLQKHAALAGMAMLRANIISELLALREREAETPDAPRTASGNPEAPGSSTGRPDREKRGEAGAEEIIIPLGDSATPSHAMQEYPGDAGYVKMSIREVMRLRSVVMSDLNEAQISFHVKWSNWRRKHQATAKWYHRIARLRSGQPPEAFAATGPM